MNDGRVPLPLLHTATWAAPSFAPFARMAIVHAIRRGLAERDPPPDWRWRRPSPAGGSEDAATAGLPTRSLPAPRPPLHRIGRGGAFYSVVSVVCII
jgi:hypothetical protein